MLQRALDKAKKGDDKKVSINFQVSSLIKEEFEKLCKEKGVSVTAMLNSLMEVSLEEFKGLVIEDYDTLKIVEKIDLLKDEYEWYKTNIRKLSDDQHNEMRLVETSLIALSKELQKRGHKDESNN